MSTQVDVLAVMDEFALYVRNVSSKHALQGDIAEARAAVAELIEALERALTCMEAGASLEHGAGYEVFKDSPIDFARAALARATGAQS